MRQHQQCQQLWPDVCSALTRHARAWRSETVRLIKRLHQFDVMRANKAPFAFGLEPRVPFLDKAFLEASMSIDPADKMARASCPAVL